MKKIFYEINSYEEIMNLYNKAYINLVKLKKMGADVEKLEKELLKSKNNETDKHFDFMKNISREQILSLGKEISNLPIEWLLDYAKVSGAFSEDEIIELHSKH